MTVIGRVDSLWRYQVAGSSSLTRAYKINGLAAFAASFNSSNRAWGCAGAAAERRHDLTRAAPFSCALA